MHERIAKEIARIEKNYPNPMSEEEVFALLDNFKYIVPQGSPMAGIGNKYQIASLSNCFVIGNSGMNDSYGSIMKIDQEQVQLMKRRGGVGHDLSNKAKRFPGKKFGPHLYRSGSFHGALFQFYQGSSPGWTPWRFDAFCIH